MRIRSLISSGLLLSLVAATPALAQAKKGMGLAVNYSILNPLKLGFSANMSKNLMPKLDVVGDVGWSHRGAGTSTSSWTAISFQAGVRSKLDIGKKIVPFGQILVGAVRQSFSLAGFSASATNKLISPGIGFVCPLNDKYTADIEIDYAWSPGTGHFWRWSGGLVFGFMNK